MCALGALEGIVIPKEPYRPETVALCERAKALIEKSTAEGIAEYAQNLVRENYSWRFQSINLGAAESAISPAARRVLISDLDRRTFVGEPGIRYHMGHRYTDRIDALTIELLKKLFKVEYVEYRPMSGSMADGLAIRILTNPRDAILALEPPMGHGSWREVGYAGMHDLEIIDYPFDYENVNIDVNKLAQIVEKVRPKKLKVIVVGLWCFLFPHPLREIRKIADEIDARLWYDGAHVLGLLSQGMFQDPLREGADVVTGSTHKTLSGPSGGLLLTNSEELYKRNRSVIYGHLSYWGHNRMAALSITLAEMLEFGRDFMKQVVANAKALGKALDEEGFDMIGKHLDYTETQQVLMKVPESEIMKMCRKLEQANIMTDNLSWQPRSAYRVCRLGVTEMTRYGMKEPEIEKIAEYIRRVIIDGEDPKKVAKEVIDFRNNFTEVYYCFKM